MSLNRGKNSTWNPVEQAIIEITAPFQRLFSNTIKGVQDIWFKYFDLINTHEENIRLKGQIAALKRQDYHSRELLATYQRLRGLLRFTETTYDDIQAARVIGRDPSGLFQSIIIDKGRDSGLSVNMPVVNGDGVVGRIVSVSDNYSKVLLLIDQNSAVDCLIQRSRDNGIVKGLSSDECVMDYVLKTSDIIVGDTIITSGIGGVFPKGIPVGEVTDIKDPSDELFLEVRIRPFVDFPKLEEILVILKEDPLAKNSKEKE